jgi:hypothetical protein
MSFGAGHPGGHQVAFVGQGHPGEHAFMQAPGRGVAHCVDHRPDRPVPQRQRSARQARCRRRPISCSRPSACAAPRRGRVQRREGRQPDASTAPAPGRQSAIVRSIDRLVPPPTSLATDTATPASSRGASSRISPAAEEQVAAGAVGHLRLLALRQQRMVGGVEPDAVREHAERAPSRPCCVRTHRDNCAPAGKRLCHPVELGAVLGHVGLHVQAWDRHGQQAHRPWRAAPASVDVGAKRTVTA